MPENRFYLIDPLENGTKVRLTGKEFHHLARVMRGEPGDMVELVNGKNSLAKGEIEVIEKHAAVIAIIRVDNRPPLSHQVILAQAITRPHTLEWIIEKGTELGASSFSLFPTASSEMQILPPRVQERLSYIAIGAMKQCGRLDLPQINYLPSLESLSQLEGKKYHGDLNKEAPLFQEVYEKNGPVVFCIGPESGFTQKELDLLTSLGSLGVRLHPYTLRAETAACVALVLSV